MPFPTNLQQFRRSREATHRRLHTQYLEDICFKDLIDNKLLNLAAAVHHITTHFDLDLKN